METNLTAQENLRVIEAATIAKENGTSMLEVAKRLGMTYIRFQKVAKRLGVYYPIKVFGSHSKDIPIEKLKGRKAIKERLTEERAHGKCEECGLSEWRGKRIIFELHHIDGNKKNNDPSNLQILCRNCHGITDNYRYHGTKNAPW